MKSSEKDLAAYMARVKVLAAKEGVKTYGAGTRLIVEAHKAGWSAKQCAMALVEREDRLGTDYASLPRAQAAE